MIHHEEVAILLSTYNGEEFIREMLDSLQVQTYPNFTVFVRDDGSTDKIVRIIEEYTHILKIHLVDSTSNVGAKRSFGLLLEYVLTHSQIEYFMFADQDDVWLPNKVQITLEHMKRLSADFPDKPLLVHTDLIVVDGERQQISGSFWAYQNLAPQKDQLNRLLVQNVITGCTVMINRKLAVRSCPIPDECVMHDWWIGLVASAFGTIYALDMPTIQYRQHQHNNVGAKAYNISYIISRMKGKLLLDKQFRQAQKFMELYGWELSDQVQRVVAEFIAIPKKNAISRIMTIIRNGIWKHGFVRNTGLLVKLISLPKD